MPYFCYECAQPRSLCPPGEEEGGCAAVEAQAAAYRAEKAAGKYAFPFLGAVPGGASKAASQKEGYIKLNRDMEAYREARRAGEQPDQVSVEAVRKNRQRKEFEERMEKRHG